MSDSERFRALLDGEYSWPAAYTFKFIVPANKTAAVDALFAPGTTSHRASKKGRYVSVSATVTMQSADEVMAIYAEAAKIDGLLGL